MVNWRLTSCSAAEHAVERGDNRGGTADQHHPQHHFLEVAAHALRPLREHGRQRVGDEPQNDADDRDRDNDREQFRLKPGDGTRNAAHWDTSLLMRKYCCSSYRPLWPW